MKSVIYQPDTDLMGMCLSCSMLCLRCMALWAHSVSSRRALPFPRDGAAAPVS